MAKDENKKPKKRVRKESSHRSFRISPKKFVKRSVNLSGSWSLLKQTNKFILANKKILLGLAVSYTLIQLMLVLIFSSGIDLNEAKSQIKDLLGGDAPAYTVAYSFTSYLFVTIGQRNNEIVGVYQNFVTIVFMLATIWVVRQRTAGEKFGFRDIFYKSQYPFIQFLVVIFAIGLSMVPMMIAGFLYAVTITGGIAVTILEQGLWLFLCFLLVLLTLYVLVPCLIAMYVVTLPEVSPMTAIKSSWNLLADRRFAVGMRVVAGYIFVLVFIAILMMILSYLLTSASELIFYFLSFMSVLIINIYTYKIYRELL
ncbi:MAG: hypothetical protein AAB914_00925 [Patescibacteria group bacterium]